MVIKVYHNCGLFYIWSVDDLKTLIFSYKIFLVPKSSNYSANDPIVIPSSFIYYLKEKEIISIHKYSCIEVKS